LALALAQAQACARLQWRPAGARKAAGGLPSGAAGSLHGVDRDRDGVAARVVLGAVFTHVRKLGGNAVVFLGLRGTFASAAADADFRTPVAQECVQGAADCRRIVAASAFADRLLIGRGEGLKRGC
jgi:hypothetical protein